MILDPEIEHPRPAAGRPSPSPRRTRPTGCPRMHRLPPPPRPTPRATGRRDPRGRSRTRGPSPARRTRSASGSPAPCTTDRRGGRRPECRGIGVRGHTTFRVDHRHLTHLGVGIRPQQRGEHRGHGRAGAHQVQPARPVRGIDERLRRDRADPGSAQVTPAPTVNQCDCTATPICRSQSPPPRWNTCGRAGGGAATWATAGCATQMASSSDNVLSHSCRGILPAAKSYEGPRARPRDDLCRPAVILVTVTAWPGSAQDLSGTWEAESADARHGHRAPGLIGQFRRRDRALAHRGGHGLPRNWGGEWSDTTTCSRAPCSLSPVVIFEEPIDLQEEGSSDPQRPASRCPRFLARPCERSPLARSSSAEHSQAHVVLEAPVTEGHGTLPREIVIFSSSSRSRSTSTQCTPAGTPAGPSAARLLDRLATLFGSRQNSTSGSREIAS